MLVTLSGVSKSFGSDTILSDINLRIENNSKIGLIGLNGSGKSTLLKMLCGSMPPDKGSISITSATTIGYLTQDLGLCETNTVYEEALTAFAHVIKQEEQLEEKRLQIEACRDIERLEKLNGEFLHLAEIFEENKGYYYKSIVTSTLLGLGFDEEAQSGRIATLSGGQKMRVALAKMLMKQPELLMLDEPTNYLDINSVSWLENYLCSYTKSYIVVLHDRYFLDKTVSTIWEADTSVRTYRGNYSAYLKQREDEIYAQNRAYEIQSNYIKKQREIIRKLKSYNREKSVRRAESREKQLDKLEKAEKAKNEKVSKISFAAQKTVSKNAFKFINASVGYDGKALVNGIDFEVRHGMKIGICGRNATGKTTFLRTLCGEIPLVSGDIIYGSGVKISYFRQHHDDIDKNLSILDYLSEYSGEDTLAVRNILGSLLFSGDEVYKDISVLSGGELSRVAVAKLMLTKSNVLLLDEPTNHLDIASKEVFEQAIRDYDGTVFVVSHDRYLLANVCDSILYIAGSSAYFYELPYNKACELFPADEKTEAKETRVKNKQEQNKERKNSLSKNEIRRSQERIAQIEKLLPENENKRIETEALINSEKFYKDAANANKVLKEYEQMNAEYRNLEEEWLRLNYLLENNE